MKAAEVIMATILYYYKAISFQQKDQLSSYLTPIIRNLYGIKTGVIRTKQHWLT